MKIFFKSSNIAWLSSLLVIANLGGCHSDKRLDSELNSLDRYRIACDAGQSRAINLALAESQRLTTNAIESLPPNNSTTDRKYRRWFGDPADYVKVKGNYQKISGFLNFQKFWCPNARFPEDDEGTYAWVPAETAGEIFFEPLFFNSVSMGVDSQAGTIIHEVGHSSPAATVDSDVTGDGNPDYGISNAEQLARTRPALARNTSDNLQYFSEDISYNLP